jgi:hypothetical protein
MFLVKKVLYDAKLTECVLHVLAAFLPSIRSFSAHSSNVQNPHNLLPSALGSKYYSEHRVPRQPQTKFLHCIFKHLAVEYCKGVQGLASGTDSVGLRRRPNKNFGNFVFMEQLNDLVAGSFDFQNSVSCSYILHTALKHFKSALFWFLCSLESQKTHSHLYRGVCLQSL